MATDIPDWAKEAKPQAVPSWASAPTTEAVPSWATAPAQAPAQPRPMSPQVADPETNVRKFLDFLAKAEGADYNVIVGGGRFNDFTRHPRVVGLRTKEGPSTAAGRYQITGTTYDDVAPKLGIRDFSPDSQDKIAIELIRRGGALEDVRSGNFQTAINKLGGTWASLPSSPYSQPKRSQEWVEKELGQPYTFKNFSPVRRDIDPASLNRDQEWLRASALMYNFWERKPFEGTQDELAEWGKDSLGNFNYNLVSMAEIASALRNATPEEKEAFLWMMDTYDNTNISWEGAGRAAKAAVTDPTNLIGLGTLGLGFVGKTVAKSAAKAEIKSLIVQSMARTGIIAGIEAGAFSAAESTIRQSVEVDAGRRKEIDLSKVGVDTAIGATAGLFLGTTADAAITKIAGIIKGRGAEAGKAVTPGATTTPQEASQVVSGVAPKADQKIASQADLGPSLNLTPAEQAEVFARQQDGRLQADQVVPPVGDNVARVEVPEINTGLRTTRLTDEPVAPLTKAELSATAGKVVEQLRDVETPELPAVLETLRTGRYSLEEQRVIAKAVQDFSNEIKTDLAKTIKERDALLAKADLSEEQTARVAELNQRVTDLEARASAPQLTDDAYGSMAGSILQDRQDPMNALKSVTVESIMQERGISKADAEQVWAELVGKLSQDSEAQRIAAQYDAKAAQALEAGDLQSAVKTTIQKYTELDGRIEATAPKAASLTQKLTELAISNVFSIKTILINMIPSGIKTLVIPGLKAILNNPFEKATRMEASAAYSAMRSSFGAALQAAKAGFRYEQAILTRDGTRLVEGELAMTGKLGGALRLFPRLLNASDEFMSRINYDSFIAGREAAKATMEATEKGLKGKDLTDYVDNAVKTALDAAMKPSKGDELVQPIVNKGLNLGLTGEDLIKYVEREAMRDPAALRKGNDEDALNFVRDVLYKRKFSGENGFSKAAQAYEDTMNKFPTIKLVIGQLFFRTPVRVFEEGIRLTPGVQLLAPNFMADLSGKNGTMRQVRANAEAMSSLVIASAVLSLYAQGRITGDGAYSDWKQQKTRIDGSKAEPYTITMSDGSTWSYRGFDPLATPVKIMINALERRDKLRIREAQGEFDSKGADKQLLAGIAVGTQALATAIRDASLVEGADNFIKTVEMAFKPDEGEDKFLKFMGDKLFLLVPNTLHKISRENDPQLRDPATFWQMVEQKVLRPIGLESPYEKAAFAYDVLGNTRKTADLGALWNVFSTATVEERTKGLSEKEQFVLNEMDRLSRVTGVTFKPPVKAPELGDFDMRTVMATDGKRTLYDVWQQNYKALKPENILYPILSAPMPEGTFKYRAAKVEEVQSVIRSLQDAALAQTMAQEDKVIQRYQDEIIRKAKSQAGLFDTPRPY
jgi:muramidase (phage lysozyme)